jgi:hypothetical protein
MEKWAWPRIYINLSISLLTLTAGVITVPFKSWRMSSRRMALACAIYSVPILLNSVTSTAYVSRGTAVGIGTGYRQDHQGVWVRVPVGSRSFLILGVCILLRVWDQEISLLHIVQTGSETHPASYPVVTGGSFSGGKATRSWSWPSPPSSDEVKKTWIYRSTPPYALFLGTDYCVSGFTPYNPINVKDLPDCMASRSQRREKFRPCVYFGTSNFYTSLSKQGSLDSQTRGKAGK